LATARKKIVALAEAVESRQYRQQLQSPVTVDAVLDVGFVPQEDKHPFPKVPYHYVFNGLTKEEGQAISNRSLSQGRCIPWAVVGHEAPNYVNLIAELIDYKRYPEGFCFLRHPSQQGSKGEGLLSYSGLATVLSKTKYYVWSSNDSFAYYESLRFIQALLAGAVPCKIDGNSTWEKSDIPGIFPSVRAFWAKAQEEDHWSMYCSARDFYISKGPLAEHLQKALRLV
jgi:hypothetical protein